MISKLLSLFFLFFHFLTVAQSFEIEWQSCYGGSDHEKAQDIIQVSDGYLVTGYTYSNNGDISYNHGETDCWVFKINNSGDLVWENTYGGSEGDNAYRILPDGEGNFYVIGATDSDDGDISNDPYPGTWDWWILKINGNGDILWEKVFGGNGLDVVWTGITTDDNGLVALGWTASNDGDISNYFGLFDGWMIKVNSEGEMEWNFTIGTDGYDVCQAVNQTSDGGYLVGCASAIWDIGNITCEPHSDYAEAVLVKLDSNLNIEWNRCYGGSDHDGATALAELNDGYVFGGYAGSNDGDISGWHGESDIWVVNVDFSGNIIWQKCLGGSRIEGNAQITIDGEDFWISGVTRSIDGDVTGNHTISEYDSDIWLVKLNSEGNLLYEHCFGGIWDEEVRFGFLKKSENNFIFAGQTDYGPSFDVACTPHGGLYDKDFWVFEIQDTTTGIENRVVEKDKIKVCPNPASEYVVFEIIDNLNPEDINLTIVNSLGRKLKNVHPYLSGNKLVWDTRKTDSGIYFYTFTVNGISKSGKVVITK